MRGLRNTSLPFFRVANPLPDFNADPDPAFHCNADPDLDPAFNFNSVRNRILSFIKVSESAIIGRQTLHGSIQPLTLLNFDFTADPDPSFHFNAGPDPDLASRNNADPDPQPCFFKDSLFSPWVGKTLLWHIFFLLPSYS